MEFAYSQRDPAAAAAPTRLEVPTVPSRSDIVARSASNLALSADPDAASDFPLTTNPDAASSLPLMADPEAAFNSQYEFYPLDEDSDLEEIGPEAFAVSKRSIPTGLNDEWEDLSARLPAQARQLSEFVSKLPTNNNDRQPALSQRPNKQAVSFSTRIVTGAATYSAAEFADETALPVMSPDTMPCSVDDAFSPPPDIETYTPPGSPRLSPIPSSPSPDIYLHQPPPRSMPLSQLHAELAATQQREDVIWNAILRQLALLASLPRDPVPRPKGWRSERREAEYKEAMLQSALELQGQRIRVLDREIGRRRREDEMF